jgi:hypothetical protein
MVQNWGDCWAAWRADELAAMMAAQKAKMMVVKLAEWAAN